ncbi:MAG: efflux transporter outer membrane subunit [Alphaproteobacteria bacterium]|nr:efflux transporter outer membrane subunit [Alphaproteobacteria bacterium]
MRNKVLTLVLVTSALSSGCTMIPDYIQPDFSAAQSWNDVPGYTLPVGEELAMQMTWQEFFTSEELRVVIGTALENNKDLATAALNIDEARALYRIERADLFPALNAEGAATYQKSTDAAAGTAVSQKVELYSASLGLSSYEIDLFGKIRSQNRAAINDYLATEQAHAVVRNALIAETANAYLQLLADEKLLALTKKTLEAQQRTYGLLSESLKQGVSTEQDVARAETAVETARVNLHQYSRLVEQDKNALFLLMGVSQNEGLLPETTLDKVEIKDNLDAGIPSEVLLLRPDIKQAEYELLARNADIGAARAAFFPSITLTGSYGYASAGLSSLFTSGAAGAYSFLPQITLPIFQGGRNQANLDLSEIRKEKAVVNYEQAIQVAFSEVSDELAARATLDEQLKAQQRLVSAARKVYNVSDARYKSGIDSFLSVLDAQRELYVFEQNEILIERQRLSNLVNLYKVLGGGTLTAEY